MAVTEVLDVPLHGVQILCGLVWLVCFVCLVFSACTECIEISLLVLQWRVGGGTLYFCLCRTSRGSCQPVHPPH